MEETMKAISNYVSDSIPDLNENRTYAGIAASMGTLVQPGERGSNGFSERTKDRKSGLSQAQVYQN
jgi:multidrug efflux pump